MTHYGPKSSQVHLDKFFEERDIVSDFEKGYFIHLMTDYLFYNKFLECFNKEIMYNDYDLTNKKIEKRFSVKVPDYIKDCIFYKEGSPKILDKNKIISFIEEISKNDLEVVKQKVLNGDEYWITIHIPKKYN